MQPSSLRGYVESDARVDRMRRANRLRVVQSELAEQEQDEILEQQRMRQLRTAEREGAMAEYLKQQKHDHQKEEKMLQLVRTNDPELRELAAKIKAAHTAKERNLQMETRKAIQQQEAEQERQYMEKCLVEAKRQDELEAARNLEKKGNVRNVQDVQREQLAAREEQRRIQEEIARKERADVDAVVAKIQEQDYLQSLQRINKQHREKQIHEEFVAKRETLKQQDHQRRVEEDRAIVAYQEEQNKRKESDAKLRLEKESLKQRILQEQSKKIAEDRMKKEELEGLINDYYQEQRAQKDRDSEIAEMEKKVKTREMMIAANEEQKRAKQLRKDQDALEEQRFRQELLDKLAKEAHYDQMNKQRQMRMKQEHAAKVQEIIDEKRRQQELDAEREEILLQQQRDRDLEWKRLVAIERAKMLAENAELLSTHLPKGLTHEDASLLATMPGR